MRSIPLAEVEAVRIGDAMSAEDWGIATMVADRSVRRSRSRLGPPVRPQRRAGSESGDLQVKIQNRFDGLGRCAAQLRDRRVFMRGGAFRDGRRWAAQAAERR